MFADDHARGGASHDEIAAAVHEAAHAVVARALGLNCGRAMITPTGGGYARVFARWRRGRRRPRSWLTTAMIIESMAGGEAEKLLLGLTEAGDRQDRERQAAWALDAGWNWPAVEPRLREMTRTMVLRHRAAVVRVALALVKHRSLSGEEIDALTAGYFSASQNR